jgi:hypothetical protein
MQKATNSLDKDLAIRKTPFPQSVLAENMIALI